MQQPISFYVEYTPQNNHTVLLYFGSLRLYFPFAHDDVMKWKHFPRYWPFVRGIHRSPVNSPHKCQWRGALNFLWSAPEQTTE